MKKLRNTWKMRLSVLLMVVMMLNMTFTAFADWREEDGGWRFYKSDGTRVVNQVREIQEKWYSFDANGFMETGWIERLGDGKQFYAAEKPGNLAEERWMKIGADWYYFEEITQSEDDLKGGAVKADQEKVYTWRKIHDQYYCFDVEGRMLHDQIFDIDGKRQYAQADGSLAMGWFLLEEDESGQVKPCEHYAAECNCSWYHFNTPHDENNKLKGGGGYC